MTRQSEQVLESQLVERLKGLEYEYVKIKDESDLLKNLKTQIEKHNKLTLTDKEFDKVLNHLNKGNVFERAKIMRDKMQLTKEDGTSVYISFINQEFSHQNTFQVTNQVTMEGSYKNRYDVTLLINGLPMVQIELKRRGLELKEAFNQIQRYQKHSFSASKGLYNYIQIFIVSNGVNTKYYANNKKQSFKQTFFWSDDDNNKITNLEGFTDSFLERTHIYKMICKYIVLAQADKILMVLRSYQYFATEKIIERVKNSSKNGYIWHTTGSGKTLTSFKASQILMQMPEVHKVVFVVDRKDLDFKTIAEFNSFSDGSVDGTDNTKALVKQFSDDTKLLVTTIQKLNNAIEKQHYLDKMEKLKDKKIVFIFDECHRSQFGETHKRITNFFNNHQLFGFTGTPIFAVNAVKNVLGKRTTTELFGQCLHKYVITDAIRDENVLKFSIEYVGKYKQKSKNFVDIEVEDINTKELLESEDRLEKIVDYIIDNHGRKTHGKVFTGMFCVSSIDMLVKYYEQFRKRKDEGKHNLKIATIFSYNANEEDKDADGFFDEDDSDNDNKSTHSRDKLEEFIGHYNKEHGTKFTTKDSSSYYNYYNDIGKRVKLRQVDILIVVNMFLTGFDAPALNTLYIDKKLKYHGLIQSYSRTNRIINEQKSQGNIVSFRNLKKATDEAIALFSDEEAQEIILMLPYEDYVYQFNEGLTNLFKLVPSIDSVNDLPTEKEELAFVIAFRELLRILNILVTFSDFSYDHLDIDEQRFSDYKSKYLDIYDKVKGEQGKEADSILDDVDFELELIHKDDINVSYILSLLSLIKGADEITIAKKRRQISDMLSSNARLRSKKELIEQFINENLVKLEEHEDISEAFEEFWDENKQRVFKQLCEEENIDPVKLQNIIDNYLFSNQPIERDQIIDSLDIKPKILERKNKATRVIDKSVEFVNTFLI